MLAMLVLLFGSEPVVRVKEPVPPTSWEQSVQAMCGSTSVSLQGYGAGRPLEKVPKLTVEGKVVTGASIDRLLEDLSRGGAAYRIQVLCGQEKGVTVRIDLGERQSDGEVAFYSGAAFLEGSRLVSYTGLQGSSADSFWFR
jgi:hypothetical protein